MDLGNRHSGQSSTAGMRGGGTTRDKCGEREEDSQWQVEGRNAVEIEWPPRACGIWKGKCGDVSRGRK